VGIISGFAVSGIIGDTQCDLQMALALFAVTGALLNTRMWRMTRKTERSPVGATAPEMSDH